MSPVSHPSFELLRSEKIANLNVQVEEYRHRKTGAQHIHIASDNKENVFLVALRTVPMDSTGVAHILEHTALCGSEKYPVRDPFFMMIRRSLNTFMNAFTSSDWTAYPFASQNRKDFNNLLDVYLDAVFFSRLDPLDFAQEGHRVEFAQPEDPNTELVFKGVVFNEMKGAMSSVPSQLWQTICKYLFPTTTYHYNSGGEPEVIPNLSYEQLLRFYRTHYHPSNAIFMTFGDIDAVTHQTKFEDQVLHRFERLDYQVAVEQEQRYHAPLSVTEHYPVEASDGTEKKTHHVLAWLLGKSTDLDSVLEAQLLNNLLLDNSASALQQALETTELGLAPSPMCGLDDSQHELSFLCGIEGSEPESAEAFELMVLSVIEQIAEHGVAQETLEASLHQLELAQREVGGDSYPYGLQLILSSLTSATHRGDPIALLNVEPALARLRESSREPDFVQRLAKKLLLDNPHRVRLTMVPNPEINARKVKAEAARLAAMKNAMSDADRQATVQLAADLKQRQAMEDDIDILPKVTVADVPAEIPEPQSQTSSLAGANLTKYAAGTNGLVYQQIVFDLPALSDDLLAVLPLYSTCLTEVGVAEKDYLQTQQWQARVAGSLNAFSTMRGEISDPFKLRSFLTLSGKALARNQDQLSELMRATLDEARFDEHNRFRELIAQVRARREMSVTGSGHSLAMTAAASGISPVAQISHRLSGLVGIQALKALDDSLNEAQQLQALVERLEQIHQLVLTCDKQYLLITEQDLLAQCQTHLETTWQWPNTGRSEPFALDHSSSQVGEFWATNTQVNFCAKAYPTVPMSHEDAPALSVLAGFLRNGYLHRSIREQGGAYGGGASHDSNSGSFRFYSYRDPRLEATLADFDESLQWLNNTNHSAQAVDEAVLGVIASMDKPSSPAGECKQHFHEQIAGRTRANKMKFRQGVLSVGAADLVRVANQYLQAKNASTAVVGNPESSSVADKLGLEVKNL